MRVKQRDDMKKREQDNKWVYICVFPYLEERGTNDKIEYQVNSGTMTMMLRAEQ